MDPIPMSLETMDDPGIFGNYAANESTLTSAEASASEKEDAWRAQAVLLQHMTRNLSPALTYDLMKKHFEKPRPSRELFLEERLQGVEALLNCGQKRPVDSKSFDYGLPAVDRKGFELPCYGFYESCGKDEVNEDDLQNNLSSNNASPSNANFAKTNKMHTSNILHFLQSNEQKRRLRLSSINTEMDNTVSNNKPVNSNELAGNSAVNFYDFCTARGAPMIRNANKPNLSTAPSTSAFATTNMNNGANTRKRLGTRRTVLSNPLFTQKANEWLELNYALQKSISKSPPDAADVMDPRLSNIDPKMIDLIRNEIMHECENVGWNDIAGLKYAKSIIQETIIYPLRRPDIFKNLRRPPRGILLFGPPGTGKTLIGKCIASQSSAKFFSISASSLTSKWVGESEKMVRALFAVATVEQPSVIFIDEIDSLLSRRTENEHESCRRLKTEFLARIEGAATTENDNVIMVGATNRPQELDDAARRRFVRRLYIPLPDYEARREILTNLLAKAEHTLNAFDYELIAKLSDGFSGADMRSLCQEASLGPIREIPIDQMDSIDASSVRPINKEDFQLALQTIRPSVSQHDVQQYIEWNLIYGAGQKT